MFISAVVNTAQSEVRLNLTAVCDKVLRSLTVVKPSTLSWDNRTEFIGKHFVKRTGRKGPLQYRVYFVVILVICLVKTSLTCFVPSSRQSVEAASNKKSCFDYRAVFVQWLKMPDAHARTDTHECIIRISL